MAAVLDDKAKALDKPVSAYGYEEVRAMMQDARSPAHVGPHAKDLQARWKALLAERQATVKPVPPNMVRLAEFHNHDIRIDVEDVPPEHYERPEFLSLAAGRMATYDRVTIVDNWRRTVTWAICTFAEPNVAPRIKVLNSVQLEPIELLRGPEEVPGAEVRFDAATGMYAAYRKSDGVRLVPPIADKARVWEELRNHAMFRKPGAVEMYP